MKTLSLLFLLSFLCCKNKTVQPSHLSVQEQLLGFWYHEAVDSTWADDGRYHKAINKLYFTPDSLFISNFGDPIINVNASYWACTQGIWKLNRDTLNFTPNSTISFSTNIGMFFHSESNQDFSCIVRSVDKERLTVTVIRHLKPNKIEEAETRVYIKKQIVDLYDRVNPYTSDAWGR
ncbi:MAG: hypothetical protein H7246_14850 [Phycisphaerae bacterium]|nr:hypothetical protein [Saprospiraceae bacterium]